MAIVCCVNSPMLFLPPTKLLNQVLQALQGRDLDDVLGGLGLDNHFFLGEGVDPLVFFRGGLADDLDLQQARDGETAWAVIAEILADQFGEFIEQAADLLLGQARGFGQCGKISVLVMGFPSIVHSFYKSGPADLRVIGGAFTSGSNTSCELLQLASSWQASFPPKWESYYESRRQQIPNLGRRY